MGFFGKKKSKQGDSTSPKSNNPEEAHSAGSSIYPSRQQERREQLMRTFPQANKSVRFASGMSSGLGNFDYLDSSILMSLKPTLYLVLLKWRKGGIEEVDRWFDSLL